MKWEHHLGLAVSAALGLFLVFCILIEAAWHPETAKAIIQAGGTADVLVGLSLTGVMAVVPFTFLGIGTYFTAVDKRLPPPFLSITLALGFLALGATLLPLYKLLAGVPGTIIAATILAYRNRPKARRHLNVDGMTMAIVVLTLTLFLMPLGWLPTQVVQHTDGDDVTGYVLNDSTDRWAVLTFHPREVVYIPSNSIEGRYICDAFTKWHEKTLFNPFDNADYPECPE